MKYKDFITYNILGGFVWSFGLVYAGYFLGQLIPNVDKYLLPIIGIIILLSILPIAFEVYKEKKRSIV